MEDNKRDKIIDHSYVVTTDLLRLLKETKNIEKFLTCHLHCFENIKLVDYLRALCIKNNFTKALVIKKSGLSESFGYEIFEGKKNPSRDKLLLMLIGMNVSIQECQKALRLAGHCELYTKNRRDAIVLFAIEKKLNVHQVNDILYTLQESTLL